MSLTYKRSHLTKVWVITLFCGCLLLGYLLTWLLVGDINLLHQQWLIPNGGVLWKGKLTSSNENEIWNHYWKWTGYDNKENWFADWGNKTCQIINHGSLIFNYLILIPLLNFLLIAIIIPLILRVFKLMEIDTIPFSVGIALVGIAFIFSGLIPTNDKTSIWIWVGRFGIVIVTFVASFFSLNAIINYFIAKSELGEQAIIDISTNERERNEIRKDLKDLQKEQQKSDSLTFVDV